MRKTLLLTMFCLLAFIASAQESVERGYRGSVDIGFCFGIPEYSRGVFSTIHGYQFVPNYLYVGAGAGIELMGNFREWAVPIFVDLKSCLTQKRVKPFVDCRLGYSVGELTGFLVSPSIGVRLPMSNRPKGAVSFLLGYTLQRCYFGYETDGYGSRVTGYYPTHGAHLKFAVEW